MRERRRGGGAHVQPTGYPRMSSHESKDQRGLGERAMNHLSPKAAQAASAPAPRREGCVPEDRLLIKCFFGGKSDLF